jgi:hypothetical protein
MSVVDRLGCRARLPIRRLGSAGASLAVDPRDTSARAEIVLLPRAEVPAGAAVGDEIDVFVHLDSEDRPIATTRTPKLERGEVAFLEVTAQTRVGAFVDWGLGKELLVPHAEQTRDVRVGERHAIGLFVDRTGRLAGTMRVAELLRDTAEFEVGEWVLGEAWRRDPDIGTFVIVERAFVGLVPASEPHALARGQATRLRVATVHPDGKIVLSLRAKASEAMADDAAVVLAELTRPGAPPGSEADDAALIRARYGLSKKAFKRAVGRLLKERKLDVDAQGRLVVRR